MGLLGNRWGISKPPLGVRVNRGHPLADGLETCLLFNEAGGTRVTDSSGFNSDVSTTISSETWTHNLGGAAITLDGVDDNVIVPVQKAPYGEMSVSAILEVTSLGGGTVNTVLSDSATSGFQLFQYFSVSDFFAFQCGNGIGGFPGATGSIAVPGLGKFHLVGTCSAAGLNIYLDGVLKGTFAGTPYVPSPAQDIWIGRYPPAPAVYFAGRFYDVRVWSRVLRADEVSELYVDPYAMFRTTRRSFVAERVTLYKPTVNMTPIVQVDVSLGTTPEWTDISADVVSDVDISWGIHTSDPKARTAEPGPMKFVLDNSLSSIGGVQGYYSPGHTDALVGWDVGMPIRFIMRHDFFGDRVRWVGTIEEIKVGVGARSQTVSVLASDWLEEAAKSNLRGLDIQVDAQSDTLFTMIVEAAAKQPPGGIQSGSGSDIYPWALDNVQDEKTKVLGALNNLMLSEYGIAHVTAGVAVFEGRRVRGSVGGIRFALDENENIVELNAVNGRDAIINRVQVGIHPRRVDATDTVVLFKLGASIEIPRGTQQEISCPYRDQNQQAQRVGGVDMQTPDAAEGDYLFNSLATGLGMDLTSQLTVNAVYSGNSATLTITNNGPLDGFIPPAGLQLRGRGLYDFEPIIAERLDQDSLDQYGENILSYDMPYQEDPNNGADLALFILSLHKDPRVRAVRVGFVANWSDYEMEQAFNLMISDKVSITAPSAGLAAAQYFVNGFRILARPSGLTMVWLDLAPVDMTEFWRVEIDGHTELDETTVLGYGLFAPGWILNTSELGVGSFLN